MLSGFRGFRVSGPFVRVFSGFEVWLSGCFEYCEILDVSVVLVGDSGRWVQGFIVHVLSHWFWWSSYGRCLGPLKVKAVELYPKP